jgi:hypothetical protein
MSKGKRGYLYHVTLAEYLHREFTHTEIQQLQNRLIHS